MAISAKKKKEITEKVYSFISEGTSHCEEKHRRCEEDQKYVGGIQWAAGDLYRQMMRERPAVPFNSIKKAVEAVANREIVERFVPKVFGREPADSGIANVLDEACRWQRDMSESEHASSMAVRSMVMSGYGCMHKYWSPTALDGEGLIIDEDVPVWNMLWPTRARQMNLADRRWHVSGKWVTVEEAEAMYGDTSRQASNYFKKHTVTSVLQDTTTQLDPSTRHFGALSWGDVRNGQWINLASSELFIVEAEWIETDFFYKAAISPKFDALYDFLAGFTDQFEIAPAQDEQSPPQMIMKDQYDQMLPDDQRVFKEQMLADSEIVRLETRDELNSLLDRYQFVMNEDFEDYRKVQKDVVRYAILTGDMVWDYGTRPFGFTYEFLTGWPVETREGIDFIGMVDVAKGPQDYKNALLSNMLAMYMSSPKQPLIIEEGALENPDAFLDQIARPSGVAFVPDGFIASQRYMTLQSPSFPPMAQELLQLTSAGVEEVFGLSSIDLNAQGDLRRVSGNVVQAAKTAGNTIVAVLFDAIRRFRRRFGLLNVRFIQDRYSPDQIIRIIGSDKAPDLEPSSNWGEVNRYDIKIDEEPVSASERIELIDKLTRTGDLGNWVSQGHIDFDTMLDLLPYIPESVKRKIREKAAEKDQKQQEIQQKDDEIKSVKDTLNLWFSLVKTLPQQSQIMQQFSALQAVAQQAEAEKQNPNADQGQGPNDMQGGPSPEMGGAAPPQGMQGGMPPPMGM